MEGMTPSRRLMYEAFKKIYAEVNRFPDSRLLRAVTQAIDVLCGEAGKGEMSEDSSDETQQAINIKRIFRLSCQSQRSNVVVTALECVQKLVTGDHLSGASNKHIIDHIVQTIWCYCGKSTDRNIQWNVIKVLNAVMTTTGVCVHSGTVLLLVQTAYTIFLNSTLRDNQLKIKHILTYMILNIFERLTVKQKQKCCKTEANPPTKKMGMKQVKSPAISIFSHLCQISLKEALDIESDDFQHKILTMEMLLSIMQIAGQTFSSSNLFITAIKHDLCNVVVTNAISPFRQIFAFSLALFFELLCNFRIHLKVQIEVLIIMFLSILEADSTSIPHKMLIMDTLLHMCEDTKCMVDVFINYDCSLKASNIFERIVANLTKVAQGELMGKLGSAAVQQLFRAKGLKCLVNILRCMVQWSNKLSLSLQKNDDNEDEDGVSLESLVHHGYPSSTHLTTYASTSGVDTLQQIQSSKCQKDIIEKAVKLFNIKPHSGVALLQSQGLLGPYPEDVAKFLHRNNRLDKTKIGEYLGEPDAANLECMSAYIEQMDFHDQELLTSLRKLLQGFRLPGEAQKINRIVEKFALHYVDCNKQGLFTSSDSAYLMAYSIIMLTTDLHSKQVKNKMTREEYITMLKKSENTSHLPEQYLSDIYSDIAENKIMVKEQYIQLGKLVAGDGEQCLNAFKMEMEGFCTDAKSLMKEAEQIVTIFMPAVHPEHIIAMFEKTWSLFLEAISHIVKTTKDEAEISLCLDGISGAIKIASIFSMTVARDSFVHCLAEVTLHSAVCDLRTKHVYSIKRLSTVAFTYVGSDEKKETSLQNLPNAAAKIKEISVTLDRGAVVHYMETLCQMSKEKLASPNPSMLGLRKLVELCHHNINRSEMEWSRIWKVLGKLFQEVGCKPSEDTAIFIVDTLLELSTKFFEKKFSTFKFQREFLHPFEHIMKNNRSYVVRNRVLHCIKGIISTQARNITSGWKIVFSVLHLAASKRRRETVKEAFHITGKIWRMYRRESTIIGDSFQDLFDCLMEFAHNTQFPDIIENAKSLLRECTRKLQVQQSVTQ